MSFGLFGIRTRPDLSLNKVIRDYDYVDSQREELGGGLDFVGGTTKVASFQPVALRQIDMRLANRLPQYTGPIDNTASWAIDVGRNVCHGSDSVESAQKEIALWFKDGEVVSWKKNDFDWVYEKACFIIRGNL
ncbi:hypothetical protein HDK77DRAFT_511925 [Phyllosticta capitalensis]